MKSLKKLLALLLVFIMAFSLVACGTDESESKEEKTTEAGTTDDDELDDDSSTTSAPFIDGTNFLSENNGYYLDVVAADKVTLADYSKITIPYDTYYLSDDDLQEQLDTIVTNNVTTEQVKDRKVKDGDTVHIVYTGTIDGIAFTGGTSGDGGSDLVIGSGTYIDDFEQQLIGHKPGETVEVKVTFPDSYPSNTDLEGQDAVFTTTIEYISEEKTPEMNDAFVAEIYGEGKGWTTVDQLKEGLRDAYKATATNDYITQYLTDNSKINETPEICTKYSKAYFEWKTDLVCANNNIEVSDYLAQNGYTNIDEFYEANSESANSQITQDLIFQAIAEKEGIAPTVKDFEEYLKSIYGESTYATYYNQFVKLMSPSVILHNMISVNVLNKIAESVTYATK